MESYKLIFVEDDPDDREMIQDALTILHADSYLVLDGARSFYTYLTNLASIDLPEAVVLDINMPELSGVDILKVLKTTEHYQQIPIYIFTCASKPALKQQCIKEGAAGYYIKPDSFEELNHVLGEIYGTIQA